MSLDLVAHLRSDGELMAEAAERDLPALDTHVPTCPEWNVGKLVIHTGIHHRWVANAIRSGGDPPADPPKPGLQGPELLSWFRAGWSELAELLDTSEDETTAWSWSGDNRVGFWRRRTALETLVHRWDAQNATGPTSPLDPELAGDGVDEWLFVMLADAGATYRGIPGIVSLRCSDIEASWHLELVDGATPNVRRGTGDGDATLSGRAEDLLLFVWGRLTSEPLSRDGRDDLLRSFVAWIQE